MAIFANQSNQLAALKELYTGDDYLKDMVYPKNPLLALMPKDESSDGFAGKYIPVPIRWGDPQGRSATFATAQTNQTAPQLSSFFVYRVPNYGLATIQNDLLEATANSAGAFVDEGKLIVDAALRNLGNDLALDMYGSGDGTRGQIALTGYSQNSTVAGGTVIPLLNVASVVNFEVGMVIVAAATAGGVPTTDTVTLTSVNRTTGVLLGTASTGSLDAKFAASAFLAVSGDIASGGSTATGTNAGTGFLKVSGLSGWLPTSIAASGDSWWGVNRAADPTRLGGVYYGAGANTSIEEAVIDGSVLVAREGGQPDMGFCSFSSWASLEKELGSKVQYVSVRHDSADIAFKGITINAPYGPITIIPDRNCTPNTMYLLDLSVWKLRTLNKAPHILTYGREGLEGLRVGTSDALEIRMGYYGNVICSAPGFNARIALSA